MKDREKEIKKRKAFMDRCKGDSAEMVLRKLSRYVESINAQVRGDVYNVDIFNGKQTWYYGQAKSLRGALMKAAKRWARDDQDG